MFIEAHPDPIPLEIGATKAPKVHLRFFTAEFLRPEPRGMCLRVTLASAPLSFQLPLVIHVPAGCFSSTSTLPEVLKHLNTT